MAVFRIERTRDYTVMSNHHLRNEKLSLKAKGLLSMMLSLPENWNYTTRGLAAICKEGVDAIGGALRELETAGYIVRHQLRDRQGRISDTEYVIYEQPQPKKAGHAFAGYGCTRYGKPVYGETGYGKARRIKYREIKYSKNQLLMDQVPIPFPSGRKRRTSRRNGKEGMRCLSRR